MEGPAPDRVAEEIADLFVKPDNPVRVSVAINFDDKTQKPDGASIHIEVGNTDDSEDP